MVFTHSNSGKKKRRKKEKSIGKDKIKVTVKSQKTA